ncbi:hypothetical protein D3C86_2066080 [compost metagenome]
MDPRDDNRLLDSPDVETGIRVVKILIGTNTSERSIHSGLKMLKRRVDSVLTSDKKIHRKDVQAHGDVFKVEVL